MEDEDKGGADGGGGGGGRAAQSGRQPIIEKKKTWSELKQACLLVPFLCFEGKELIALSNFEIAEEYRVHLRVYLTCNHLIQGDVVLSQNLLV